MRPRPIPTSARVTRIKAKEPPTMAGSVPDTVKIIQPVRARVRYFTFFPATVPAHRVANTTKRVGRVDIREKLLSGKAAASFAIAGVTTVNPMDTKYRDSMAMVSFRPTLFFVVLIRKPPFSFHSLFLCCGQLVSHFPEITAKSVFCIYCLNVLQNYRTTTILRL